MKRAFLYFAVSCATLLFTCSWNSSFAQDQQNQWDSGQGELDPVEIDIVKERQITLPQVNRQFEKIPPRPFEPIEPAITYDYKKLVFSTPQVSPTVRPLRLKQETPPQYFGGYLTGGYGSYASPFFDLYVNTPDDRDKLYGAHAWLSSSARGPVDNKNSGDGDYGLSLYGRRFSPSLSGGLNFDFSNRFTHFYGYPAGQEVSRDTTRQSYNSFVLGADLASARNTNFKYSLKGSGSYLQDRFSASEGEFDAAFSGDYDINDNNRIQVESNFMLADRKDEEVNSQARTLFNVEPHYDFLYADKFKLRIGANASLENDTIDSRSVHLYPDVAVTFPVSKYVSVSGSLNGGEDKVTLRTLSNENIWIGPAIPLAHTNRLLDLTGSIQARLGGKFVASAGFSVAAIKNLYFFVNDSSDVSRFQVVYDQGTTKRSDIFGSVEYVVPDIFHLNIRADLFGYDTDKVPEAWHKPGYTITGSMQYDLYKKIMFTFELEARGDEKAYDPTTQAAVTLDAALDLGARIEYKFSNTFSMFVRGNNLLSTKYPLFFNYPARGLQVAGGLCWTF